MQWLAQYWKSLFGLALVVSFVMMAPVKGSSSSASRSAGVELRQTADSNMGRQSESETLPDVLSNTSGVIVRFFFIRHGETLANEDGLVLGQLDSPLTEIGEQQARSLGRSDLITKESFWRRYVSDLGRAQRTANLILGEDRRLVEDHGVRLEPRLRELAKGAREGYPKSISYQEAEVQFRKDNGPTMPFPLLETEADVFARMQQFLFEVVGEAIREHASQCSEDDDASDEDASDSQAKVYSVFALSHAGVLRATIGRLVPEQLPADIDLTPVGRDGASSGAMRIPNTSVTIIDIIPHNTKDETWDLERSSQVPPNPTLLWTCKLKTLTWTEHYQDV